MSTKRDHTNVNSGANEPELHELFLLVS